MILVDGREEAEALKSRVIVASYEAANPYIAYAKTMQSLPSAWSQEFIDAPDTVQRAVLLTASMAYLLGTPAEGDAVRTYEAIKGMSRDLSMGYTAKRERVLYGISEDRDTWLRCGRNATGPLVRAA